MVRLGSQAGHEGGGDAAGVPGGLLQSPHPASQPHLGKVGTDRVMWRTAQSSGAGRGGMMNMAPPDCPVILRNARASYSFPYQTLEDDGHSDTDDLSGNHNNSIQQLTSWGQMADLSGALALF